MVFSSLPSELVTLIFLKIPVEDLAKLRRVNRFCFHFISGPDFVKAQLKGSNVSRCCFFSARDDYLEKIPIQRLLHQIDDIQHPVVPPHFLKNPVFVDFDRHMIVGSCNGLICVVTNKNDYLLWNPLTGKCKLLPPPDVQIPEIYSCRSVGFGYDESTDDYMVVLAVSSPLTNFYSKVMVFSLKSNYWKKISDIKGGSLVCDSSKLASGKIHWLFLASRGVICKQNIHYFDLKEDVFGLIEQPDYSNYRTFGMELGLLGGCVCVCVDEFVRRTYSAELWIMKEHGIKTSWTKLLSLPSVKLDNYPWLVYPKPWEPCLMLPSGDIILVNNEYYFGVYNPKDKSFKSISQNRIRINYFQHQQN